MLEVHLFMDDTILTNFSLVHRHLFMGDSVIPNNISFDALQEIIKYWYLYFRRKLIFYSKNVRGSFIYGRYCIDKL